MDGALLLILATLTVAKTTWTKTIESGGCTVGGSLHRSGSHFTYVDGCIQRTCFCKGNEKYVCPDAIIKNICASPLPNTTHTGGNPRKPGKDQNINEFEVQNDQASQQSGSQQGGRKYSESGRPICQDCEVNGETYTGHTRFKYTDGCFKYQCVCRCDGSYYCPSEYTANTCETASEDTQPPVECRTCVVEGQEFQGNKYFSHTADCTQYESCICRCDGSWECPPDRAKNVCGGHQTARPPRTGPDRCIPCNVKGNTVRGNSHFAHRENCIEYDACLCNCDGSWECPAEQGRNICDSQPTARPLPAETDRCRTCSVKGNTVRGNSYFAHRENCIEYDACLCKCDGSWECPAEQGRNVCDSQPTARPLPAETDRCRTCSVKGNTVRGNSYFAHREECIEYDACLCKCDGSWECPAEQGRNVCDDAQSREQGGNQPRECKLCTVRGQTYKGNSYFSHRDGCIEYDACICQCDGSWDCPAERGRNVCDDTGTQESDSNIQHECGECRVHGQIFPGNQYFSRRDGCTEYDACICRCDGSWECPPDRSRNVCGDTRPQPQPTQPQPQPRPQQPVCTECYVYGKIYQGNTQFKHVEGCFEYNCECSCIGGWSCPSERTVDICQTPCDGCEVYGQHHAGNTTFKHREDCNEWDCICNCDGSWNCPAENAVDICRMNHTTGCYSCDVYGRQIEGNSYFQHKNGCIDYQQCLCKCDGGWNCPGEHAVDVCRQNVSTGCYFCEADGYRHQGNSRFELVRDCFRYECICNCDGGWDCSHSIGVYVCGQGDRGNERGQESRQGSATSRQNERVSGSQSRDDSGGRIAVGGSKSTETSVCRHCKVDDRTYRGNTQFYLQRECIRYECDCRCDGGYDCPSHRSRDLCSGSGRQSTVGSIIETQGAGDYTNHTTVERTETDRSSSSTVFGGGTVIHTGGSTDYERRGPTRGTGDISQTHTVVVVRERQDSGSSSTQDTGFETSTCRRCEAEGRMFEPNSKFQLQKDCFLYRKCQCKCDGSWRCSPIGAVNICEEGTDGCRRCLINGTRYDGNSHFELTHRCIHYKKCQCNCNGGWLCLPEGAIDICNTQTEQSCRSCNVNGYQYNGNTRFEVQKECWRLSCSCNCDGSYSCPRDTAKYTCIDLETSDDISRCQSCVIDGTTYRPNTQLFIQKGCEFHRCRCMCDGTSSCELERTSSGCRQWRAGTEFQTRNTAGTTIVQISGGYQETQTGGGYQPTSGNGVATSVVSIGTRRADKEEDVLESSNTHTGTETSGSLQVRTDDRTDYESTGYGIRTCSQCVAEGTSFDGGESFNLQRGCERLRCHCYCNGTYDCPQQTPVNTCNPSNNHGSQTDYQACGKCYVHGKIYPGNTQFEYERSCIRFQCRCECNGAWNCPHQFRNGNCEKTDGGSSEPQCTDCVVKGSVYESNSDFQFIQGCHRFTCNCNCDGSWNCPAHNTVNICETGGTDTGTCRRCDVRGSTYPANSKFVLRDGCSQSTCRCNCDGSWNCPAKDTVNVCDDHDSNNCMSCSAHGQTYPGNRRFQYRDGCFEFHCQCNCDGSFTCPATDTVNACLDGPQSHQQCQLCNAHGKNYQGDSQFQFRDECLEYNCQCHCNGSWICPAKDTVNLCTDSCSTCEVNGSTYGGNSDFQYEEDCLQYNCECRCNGSWECPAERTVNICKSTDYKVDRHCQNCVVRGNTYAGVRPFHYTEGCFRYACKCACDGSYNCPRELTVNTCKPTQADSSLGERSSAMSSNTPSKSGSVYLTIENSEPTSDSLDIDSTHASDKDTITSVSVDIDSGSVAKATVTRKTRPGQNEHIAGVTTDNLQNSHVATNPSDRHAPGTCSNCEVDGQAIRGGSPFTYIINCMEFLCECQCDGGWDCPAERSVDICQKEDGTRTKPSSVLKVKGCKRGKRTYFMRLFTYTEDCVKHTCICNENGTYRCPANLAKQFC